MGPSGAVGGKGQWVNMTGGALATQNTTNAATFADPTAPNPQPPVLTSGANIGTCGIPNNGSGVATIPGNIALGPYLYYSYHQIVGGKPVPDGAPIALTGTKTFSQGLGVRARRQLARLCRQ